MSNWYCDEHEQPYDENGSCEPCLEAADLKEEECPESIDCAASAEKPIRP